VLATGSAVSTSLLDVTDARPRGFFAEVGVDFGAARFRPGVPLAGLSSCCSPSAAVVVAAVS